MSLFSIKKRITKIVDPRSVVEKVVTWYTGVVAAEVTGGVGIVLDVTFLTPVPSALTAR